MTILEREILEIITHLDEEKQRRLLEIARELREEAVPRPVGRPYTAGELMALPFEERNRIARELLASSRDEDFEIFDT